MTSASDPAARSLITYLRWASTAFRSVVIRGTRGGETSIAVHDIVRAYVSLPARQRLPRIGRLTQGQSASVEDWDLSWLSPENACGSVSVVGRGVEGDGIIGAEECYERATAAVLTGGAGSGKSTVLHYLMSSLAQQLLSKCDGHALPDDRSVPVPVYFPMANYSPPLAGQYSSTPLLEQAQDYLRSREVELGFAGNFFNALLQAGIPVLLMVDGLDETADEHTRVAASRAIEEISQSPYPCSLLITSRPSAYRGDVVLPPFFREFELQELSSKTVRLLAEAMTQEIYSGFPEERESAVHELSAAIKRLTGRRGAGSLVTSPLMVRMLASIQMTGVELAGTYRELFSQYIEAVLTANYRSGFHSHSTKPEISAFSSALCEIAYFAHRKQDGRKPLQEDDISRLALEAFVRASPAEAAEDTRRFMESVCDRGGLLARFGDGYRFETLALEDYLVGRYLAERLDSSEVARLVEGEGAARLDWWRAPLEAALGEMPTSRVSELFDKMRDLAGSMRNEPLGLGLMEWLAQCRSYSSNPDGLAEWLRAILFKDAVGTAYPRLRNQAASVLVAEGDPRREAGANPPVTRRLGGCLAEFGPRDGGQAILPGLWGSRWKGYLGAYSLSVAPVTNQQFAEFVRDEGYSQAEYWSEVAWRWIQENSVSTPAFWGSADWANPGRPVVGVSHYEARAFCTWLSARTGKGFRLPTEWEWEHAASPDGRQWPWGDEHALTARANTLESGIGTTSVVGLFNESGFFDLAGNVWEWTGSMFAGHGVVNAIANPASGFSTYVIRGGSWLNDETHAMSANRDHYPPFERHSDLGFRLVLDD